MRVLHVLILLTPALVSHAQQKPDNVSVTIWVREDIFAGFLANDKDRVQTALGKLESALAKNPKDPAALVWSGSAALMQAVYALESGSLDEFEKLYTKALQFFDDAVKAAPRNGGVQAVIGVTWSNLADRLPEKLRTTAHRRAYEAWLLDRQFTGERFQSRSEHSRGEMLAATAQAAARLGLDDEARRYLRVMAEELPGTAFEVRAKRWLERPDLLLKGPSCQSCHEPGRLAAQQPVR